MKNREMKHRDKIRDKKRVAAVIFAAAILAVSGCGAKEAAENVVAGNPAEPVDAVSSASEIFYKDSALDREQLWAAIGERKGACTIATVNEDGSPNLIVAVPATAGEEHIYFTRADNVSRANALRTGQAVVSYYIYDADAESKTERNIGARLRLELERDEKVIEQLSETDPTVEAGTVFKVAEILPLG